MAFPFDGFSIRGYTSKMRSIDVLKCWPFTTTSSGDVTKEDLQTCLPPMTVPKFRWWSDELEAVRSDHDDIGKSGDQLLDGEISRSETESLKSDESAGAKEERLDMVCPVCRVFNAATLTAVNAHIDGCLAQTMREERRQMKMMGLKSKSKAPKKRSIAEIFEVKVEQPRIQTLFKIWPFSKNQDELSITVTKFQWLSRQLEALRSNQSEGECSRNENESAKSEDGRGREEEKLEMVCPVCRAFNAATVTAVNAHIDGCLAQAMREERWHMRMKLKPKPKAPKKRSIAEILTVAPQIEAKSSELIEINEEKEEEGEEKSDGDDDYSSGSAATAVVSTFLSNRNANKNRKKKKMQRSWKKKLKKKRKMEKQSGGAVTLDNDKETVNQYKKKKKKLFNNGLNPKKDDAYKRKVKSPAKSFRKPKGTIGSKSVALDDINASAQKKKATLKHESVEKKQETVPLIHGILKNDSTHVSGKTSSGCNIQDGIEDRPCDVQEKVSARHVTFSNKDNILGLQKRSSSDEKMFSLSSDGQATLSVKEQCSGSDEALSLKVNKRDNDIAFNMDRKKEVVESKQFSSTPEQVSVQNFLRPCTDTEKKKHLVEKSESLTKVAPDDNDNLHLFGRGNTTALHSSGYSGISRPLSVNQAGNISGKNALVGDSGACSFRGNFVDHYGDSTYQVSAMNSDASTRTFLQPSPFYYALYSQGSERSLFPSQTCGDNDNSSQTLGYRPLSHMFSANNCMDKNFFGLPLNSQGELINFSSRAKGGMDQSETSSLLRSSSCGLLINNIAYKSSQEYLSINENHFVQKAPLKDSVSRFPHYPARLGVADLQGSERADIYRPSTDRSSYQFVHPLDSELKLMKYPFIMQNQDDQVQNPKRNRMISLKKSSDLSSQSSTQPTMRLMGKDVPIGRSIKEVQVQQFEADVWADQQSRRRHSSGDAALENSFLEICSKQDRLSGSELQISSENMTWPVNFQSNQALQSTTLMNGPEFGFPQPFLHLQTNHVSQNGSWGFSKTASCYSHPITDAHASVAAFNRAPHDLAEQFPSGSKFQGHATCNYSRSSDRKELPFVTKSAFEGPLVHPAFGEHAKTSWFQSSDRSLPPWLLSSKHESLPVTTSQQISGQSSQSFPHAVWGVSFPTPANHSTEVLNCSLLNHSHMKSPPGPASAVQPPLLPQTPTIKPSLTIRSGCRSKSVVHGRVTLEDKRTNDHLSCNNTRKRSAANLDGSKKLIKLSNIEVHENLNSVAGLIQENSSCEFRRSRRTGEVDPRGDSKRNKCCCLNEAQNMKSRSYLLGLESPDLIGKEISGPVRLGPGTKHILKPSENVDQDNSRPFHPIPVAAATDTDRDLYIQRKLTKIYKF